MSQSIHNLKHLHGIADSGGGQIVVTNPIDPPPYYAGIHRDGVSSALEVVLTFIVSAEYKNILVFSGNCPSLTEWQIGNKVTVGVDFCAWFYKTCERNADTEPRIEKVENLGIPDISSMNSRYGSKNIRNVLDTFQNTHWFEKMRRLLNVLYEAKDRHRTLIIVDRSFWRIDYRASQSMPPVGDNVEERVIRQWEKLPEYLKFKARDIDIVLICDSQQEANDICNGIWFRKNLACLKASPGENPQEMPPQRSSAWRDVESIEIPSVQSSGFVSNLFSPDTAHLSIYERLRTVAPIIPDSPLKMLDGMIGMGHLRETLEELENFVKIRQRRIKAGLEDPNSQKFLPHLALLGPPGVGKTTVARIIARIYYNLGLITKCDIREVTRSDLTDSFVGGSEKKARELFESSVGGVVFIDEAYNLDMGGNNDFGKVVINELVAWMNPGRNVVFILAGYEEPTLEMLRKNEGLDSKVRQKLTLQPYSDSELVEIAHAMAKLQNYTINPDAGPEIQKRLQVYRQDCERGNFKFGNARIVETLIQGAVMQASGRFAKDVNADLSTLLREDFNNARLDSPTGENHECQ